MSVRDLPKPVLEVDVVWANRFIQDVEDEFRQLRLPFGSEYSVTNSTKRRIIDSSSITHAQLAEFVATLTQDLIDAGKLGDTTS